jgi:transcriptional regulator of acetoin/glycerol metabolism
VARYRGVRLAQLLLAADSLADRLGMSRSTLYRRIRTLGVTP